MFNNDVYILIMAGGEGTRFYPVSTPEKPKQFLSFWGERTFIQQTYNRVVGFIDPDRIYVATNSKYVSIVQEQLPLIPDSNIIGETEKKNTAPCIVYTTKLIYERDPNAVIVVLPSDHVINKDQKFQETLSAAINIAKNKDVLVTLGIEPAWAADCYGYIKLINSSVKRAYYEVDRFVEKPSVHIARDYLDAGDYVWNSGMFIWRASVIFKEAEVLMPELIRALNETSSVASFFNRAESISIDYGIMEKSNKVVTIPCNIGWSDVGTWEGLYNLSRSSSLELAPDIEDVMMNKIRG